MRPPEVSRAYCRSSDWRVPSRFLCTSRRHSRSLFLVNQSGPGFMVVLCMFPIGIMQTRASIEPGTSYPGSSNSELSALGQGSLIEGSGRIAGKPLTAAGPDLEHAQSAVLNSLTSVEAQRSRPHAAPRRPGNHDGQNTEGAASLARISHRPRNRVPPVSRPAVLRASWPSDVIAQPGILANSVFCEKCG